MTDQRMHDRLLEAGGRWRDAQLIEIPEPQIAPRPARIRRRPAVWTISAAVVAAAVVALVLALTIGAGPAPRPVPPGNPATIEGIRWTDPSYEYTWPPGSHAHSGSYIYRVKPARWLRIGADGRVTGFDGCAAFSGHARLTGRYIIFGPLNKSALRPCTKPGPAQDALVIDRFLTGRVHWSIVCQRLWLTRQEGEVDYDNPAKPWSRADLRCMQRYSKEHS